MLILAKINTEKLATISVKYFPELIEKFPIFSEKMSIELLEVFAILNEQQNNIYEKILGISLLMQLTADQLPFELLFSRLKSKFLDDSDTQEKLKLIANFENRNYAKNDFERAKRFSGCK